MPGSFGIGWMTLLGLLFLGALGCGHNVALRTLPSPVLWQKEETLDPKLLDAVMGERQDDAYRLGPGDTLLVAVYGHPELSIASYAFVSMSAGKSAGLVIDNDGSIQLPLIGSVKVAGKTAEQLRAYLEEQLAVYVKEPKVTIQIVFNGSIRYYLVGQFTNPGLKYSDRPLRLLEALALGGSVAFERASLRGAYVARGEVRLPINFRRLLREGDLRQNIYMRSGDIVVVPDNTSEQAFVFGGTSNGAKGGAVPFRNGRLDLLQALTQAGYGIQERGQGKLSDTRIIRSEGQEGRLFIVDANKILNGEAAPFELVPGDVVFVPPRVLTHWNQVINQLLPTLQTVSGLLTPFVQIRYLQQSR